ncbi:MAG: large repetitive protein, partial [Frankiaceae bacterium]|nr:large repetitive protein [Frankiaceae bacterium]
MLRTHIASNVRAVAFVGAMSVAVAAGQVLLATGAYAATTLIVSTTADVGSTAGACGSTSITTAPFPLSLREATCLANNIGGAVTITVPAGTYHLTNGEIQVGKFSGQNVTVTGAGAASTVIDAGGLNRVVDLDVNLVGGVTVAISGVTISGGNDNTYGGAGIIAGSANAGAADVLTIDSSIITNNHVPTTSTNRPGGAVQFIGGSLTITNTAISNNSSGNSPGSGVTFQAQGIVAGEHL